MKVVQNKSSIPFEQHQKAMSALEKRLAKANAKLAKLKAKAEKDHQRAQAKLERERQQAQEKLDKQKKKDQAAIAKLVAKFEAEKVKETQQRERKEAAKWEKEIRQEEQRQTKVRDQQRWKGSKKLGVIRNKLKTQLTKIFKRQEDEIKSLEKAYKKFQSKRPKKISESWDAEFRAEEELRQWDREIREEEERRETTPRLVSRAIKKNTEKWSIDGNGYRDPRVFLNNTTSTVEDLINNTKSRGKKVNTALVWRMVRSDPKTGEDVITIAHFRSITHSIISEEDTTTEYSAMKSKIFESLASYQKLGSGWRLHSAEGLEIFITKYKPLNGKSYKPLPKVIAQKKAVINMENNDNQCFKWAVARVINPTGRDNKNPGRVSKILRKQAENLDWEGVEFPMKVKDITKFEVVNGIRINVFSYDDESKAVYTLRLSKLDSNRCVNLFLYDDHYSAVNDISRLITSQLSKKEHKKHICIRYLNAFGSPKLLAEHLELCKNHDHQRHVYPKDGSKISFESYHKTTDIPFVIYADFESFIEPIDTAEGNPEKSYTMKYQRHEPSGFCYTIKCFDESVYPGKTVLYTMKEESEDIGKKFVESVEEDMREVYTRFKDPKPINMSEADEKNFGSVWDCYACGKALGDDRVRDHCHYTGKYRGAAHNKCNVKMRKPKFITVLFHNLEGYDSHLFVKSLGLSEGKVGCIPKTDEKYISFNKEVVMETYTNKDGKEIEIKYGLRFLDSLKFTLSSLDSLVGNLGDDQFNTLEKEMGQDCTQKQMELLKRKRVFPYEFMTGYDKLQYSSLPKKEDFYSRLNNTDISDSDYEHAKEVWEAFDCKTMRDYHNLYLKTDVLLLADVMEGLRKVCKVNYGLDALWYYTAPGLVWDAALKMTGIELDLLTDPNMYLMVEQGIRGGISTITKRHAKANNKYMKDYNPEEDSAYIPYLDANNLYGWAMSEPLPVGDFKWMIEADLKNWESHPCILEVDLEYPEKLHDLHNEYPLAAERVKIGDVEQLIPNLSDKKNYVIHHKNLK